MLEINSLGVRLGGAMALRDVSLSLPTGQVLAVLGPSGSGKSTMLRAIAGLETPATGTISFDGEDLAGLPPHRRGFALMFQDGQLFAHQSVARNVGYPLRLRRQPRARIEARVAELLDLVGLSGFGDRSPATLSGGERQRVALARALAVEPRLLLLDEPLSALDASLRDELADQLREILRVAGTTAVMVTHDQEEAFAVADRMALLRAGRLVQEGPVDEVWAHPADEWAALFLGYATVIDSESAARLRGGREVGPLALRRSALRVDPEGPVRGRVTLARSTPEQLRLEVEVDGVGTLAAVADPRSVVRPGSEVRLALDETRAAALPAQP